MNKAWSELNKKMQYELKKKLFLTESTLCFYSVMRCLKL